MKKTILFFLSLSITVMLQAQVSKTLECTAGYLTDSLTSVEKNTVTNLTLTGTIDARDFVTMRDSMPVLAVLDLGGVTVNTYTGTLGTAGTSSTTYPANAIPNDAFFNPGTSLGKISLTSVIMPSSVTIIGSAAFRWCSGLTSVTIPPSVTTIGAFAFQFCSGLTSVTIPSLVTSIGDYAFYNCSGLTSITIPSSVTSIGEDAFCGSSGLITVEPGNPNYSSSNSVLFNKAQTTLLQCPTSKTGSYTIPSSVTLIHGFAFYNCSGLTSVTIPPSVTSIGDYDFYGCSGLTSITIPSSVTSIGSSTFTGCSGLTSITLPFSVTTIGTYAFQNCTGLTSITILSSVTSIGSNAFVNCKRLKSIYAYGVTPIDLSSSPNVFNNDSLTKIILYVPAGSYSAYQAANQWSDFTNIVEYALTVSSATASIAKEANSKDSVDVTSNTSWTASSDETWLTVSPDSGIGNVKLIFIAEANSAITTRTATITVSAMGVSSKTITITQDAGTGTGLIKETTETISLYPNPVKNILYLSTVEGVKQVEIINIEGRVIANLKNITSKSINLSNLDKGVYLFHITTESGILVRKIIKE